MLKGDEEMLSIYFLCLLSVFLSVQSSTYPLNTTDNDVRKFTRKVFVKVSDNPRIRFLASALFTSSLITEKLA